MMDDIREQQTNKHILCEKPPDDEETKKKLLELKLIPTKWEQRLFEQPWLPVAMLTPIGGLFLVGLAEDIYYYFEYFRSRDISFQLFSCYFSLDMIYVSFAILFMVLVWLFQRFAKQTPHALCRLWENSIVSPKTVGGETDIASTLAVFLTRYEAALSNRKRFISMGTVLLTVDFILVNHIKDALSFETFINATWTLFLVFKWVIFPNLWLWIILTAGWSALVTAYFIRHMPQELTLKVVSSHPDQCGGLKPIGDVCLQLALIAVIASLVTAYFGSVGRVLRTAGMLPKLSHENGGVIAQLLPERFLEFSVLFDPTRPPELITRSFANFGTVVGIIGGGWLFFYPMLGIHDWMKAKKAEFAHTLAEVASEFDIELEQSIRAKDGEQIKKAQSKLETLEKSYSLLQNYPVWPISKRNFVVKFITPEFLTIVGLILNTNVETASKILGWIRQWPF